MTVTIAEDGVSSLKENPRVRCTVREIIVNAIIIDYQMQKKKVILC